MTTSNRPTIARREFLRLAAVALGATGLAACGQQAPSPPAEKAAKPAAGQTSTAPTTAPATTAATPVAQTAGATPPATAKPAAAPTTVPVTASEASDAKLGAHLIGKLEGPEIVTDAAQLPKSFKEAPMLAELVKAGTLPPVEQRLPSEPLVVKPVHEVGKYGGTWRRAFTGRADGENGNRIVATDKLLFWDYTGTKVVASAARDWKVSDDSRTITVSLRKGLRWSDGQPFTANDVMFWFEEMYQNKDLVPTPTPEFSINGKPGTIEKIDDYTVAYKFQDPYPFFVDILAGDTQVGRGQATGGYDGRCMGGYAPGHYLKQFHAKFASQQDLDRYVNEAGVDNWVKLFKFKSDWSLNPDLPVLTPWKTTSPINKTSWVLERNPYYWEVDTEGNQLPYIDKIQMSLAENLEVVNLRAIAGEYDSQERHTDLAKLPVFLENQQKGGYKVHLDPRSSGADTTLHVNLSYEADPEIARWLTNRDFRRALALGIDREQLNQAFWLGLGTTGSVVPEESSPYNPGPEWRTKWSTYDPKQANELLDTLGLDKKDGEGYRLRTDNGQRLRLEMMAPGGTIVPFTPHVEMIREHWKKIGIQGDVKEVERGLAFSRVAANDHQLIAWSTSGSEHLLLFPDNVLPVLGTNSYAGPLFGKWYASGGSAGKKPTGPQILKMMELFKAAPGLSAEERARAVQDIWKIIVDEQWLIGTVGLSPAGLGVRIVKNNVGNTPARQVNAQHARTPGASHPATFFFKS